jgi:hypothetical protein
VDGVESIDVSLEKASADIRLKPDNRVTLAQLRAAIKKNGYATRDAEIDARGRIVVRNGKPALDLLNGSTISLDRAPNDDASDRIMEIIGVVKNGSGDVLTGVKIR